MLATYWSSDLSVEREAEHRQNGGARWAWADGSHGGRRIARCSGANSRVLLLFCGEFTRAFAVLGEFRRMLERWMAIW
jgi:hypothetical protein